MRRGALFCFYFFVGGLYAPTPLRCPMQITLKRACLRTLAGNACKSLPCSMALRCNDGARCKSLTAGKIVH
jgi:hypothetical protein